MTWNEGDHPRDELGRFTFSGGGEDDGKTENDRYEKPKDGVFRLEAKVDDINTKEAADILYESEKVQKEAVKAQNSYRNKLLDVLGDKATSADVLYGNIKKLEKKIKDSGLEKKLNKIKDKTTNALDSIKNRLQPVKSNNRTSIDPGFDKSAWDIKHYYKISEDYNKELGDFLRKNTDDPSHYSNDLRHQYVSAIFARNLGDGATKIMGELNEFKDGFHPEDPGDSDIDRINNEIGREYARRYPTIPRQELLKLMFNEYADNRQIRIQKMKELNKRNLDNEYK